MGMIGRKLGHQVSKLVGFILWEFERLPLGKSKTFDVNEKSSFLFAQLEGLYQRAAMGALSAESSSGTQIK